MTLDQFSKAIYDSTRTQLTACNEALTAAMLADLDPATCLAIMAVQIDKAAKDHEATL